MSNQTLNDRWFSEHNQQSKIAAANIIRYDYMKKLWIQNYDEFSLCILMTDTASNLLHDKFRTEKQFWSLFNYFIVHLKHHSADSEVKM